MDKKPHITPEQFLLQNMTPDELAHIASCDFCADAFADYVEGHALLAAPKHMQASILARSRQPDVQIIAKSNHASKKLQLFYYSLKVGFATAFALGLLIWSPAISLSLQQPSIPRESLQAPVNAFYDKAMQISDKINGFSKQLFQLEESFYDKQEK